MAAQNPGCPARWALCGPAQATEAVDHSLAPRGPGLLFDLVAELGRVPGSVAVDVAARVAGHCIELSRRFGFTVHGVEPVRRHLDNAARALEAWR
jgi:hypothetical protein